MLLGTCPALAVTTTVFNALGMGIATTLVLICSNLLVSLLKKVIPDSVRIPCYIIIISVFVTIVGFLLEALSPDLFNALGIFFPLITVNCIVFGRAEVFASKNSVFKSVLDGAGMGLGFTFALFLMGAIRELLGSGTFLGFSVTDKIFAPINFFVIAPGGFFVFGVLIAVVNKLYGGAVLRKKKEFTCGKCPAAAECGGAACGSDEIEETED